jgi:hypothetical protein
MSRTLRRYLFPGGKRKQLFTVIPALHRRLTTQSPFIHFTDQTVKPCSRCILGGARAFVRVGGGALQGAEHLAANRRGRIRRRLIPCCSSAGTLQPPKKNSPNKARRSIARGADSSRCEKRIRKSLTERTPEVGVSRGCSRNCVVAWRDRALPPHFKSVTLYSPIECGQGRNSSALFCDFRTNCPVVSALL